MTLGDELEVSVGVGEAEEDIEVSARRPLGVNQVQ